MSTTLLSLKTRNELKNGTRNKIEKKFCKQ